MGPEYGTVEIGESEVDENKLANPLKKIIKKANEEDKKQNKINLEKNKKAFETCKKEISKFKLEMELVEARYLFDRSKLVFYFTADERIDFRELVKSLAAIFKTRIELRQIGIRDQIKRFGGNGVCGRELCCCAFQGSGDSVTIKMAKEQNLSLNASKITGACGRLMCCLKYEQNVYEDKQKNLPHSGAIVKVKEGEGTVENVEVLKGVIKVKLKDEEGNNYFKRYNADEVTVIKDNKKYNKDKNQGESEEELKELEKIEKLDKIEKKNSQDDDV